MEGLANVALLDRAIVLANLGQAGLGWPINLISLVRLDRLVMDPALVLRHQDVVLLPLLLRLDLRVERVDVLLLHLLLLHARLPVQVVHVVDLACSILGKQCIVPPVQILLRLLLEHLETQRLPSI